MTLAGLKILQIVWCEAKQSWFQLADGTEQKVHGSDSSDFCKGAG